MQIRTCRLFRLALLVPVIAMLPLASVWSLGLSEIEVDSALNEKFSATIQLLDAGDLSKDEVLVAMATREDFDRVGVERFFYLTDLQFDVDLNGSVKQVVVTSSQTISEPYLNFIVEVRWPQGRLLKEFTVLLDPPTFSSTQAPSVSAPAVASAPQRSTTQTRGDRVRVAPQSTPRVARAIEAGEGEIVSTMDDTLWKIAQRTVASDRVSTNQQMLALQKLNPNAFIRNNINLLKAGYRLRVPTEAQALELNEADAIAEVRDQTNSWRNPGQELLAANNDSSAAEAGTPTRSQLDATEAQTSDTGGGAAEEGQVRIVANSGQLAQGSATEGTEASAQMVEENATLSRQVDELSYQLDREKELAASQVELAERQLEVKDQALAELQRRVSELESSQNSDNQQQNQTANQPAPELPWWQSPLVLGGVIGVLVLLLAGVLVSNRRNRDDDEDVVDYGHIDYQEDDGVDDAGMEPHIGAASEAVAEDLSDADSDAATDEDDFLLDDDDVDEVADDTEEDAQPSDTDEEQGGGDVIAEADIYIAYGRYGQAAGLLVSTLNNEPDRHDVRLKLLEVCVEDEDAEQFSENAEYLVANCDDDEILLAVRELEAGLSERVAGIDELDDAAVDSNDTQDQGESATDETSFELDDFDLDADAAATEEAVEDQASAEPTATAGSEAEVDFELEFDDDGLDTAADDQTDERIKDDLGGDLGLDFDPDAKGEDGPSAEPEVATDSEFDLDALDLDETSDDVAAEAPQESAENEGLNDFDFGSEGESDVNTTKLDLAEAYIDMGDGDGARDILREVLDDGSDEQKAKAQALLDGIG